MTLYTFVTLGLTGLKSLKIIKFQAGLFGEFRCNDKFMHSEDYQ